MWFSYLNVYPFRRKHVSTLESQPSTTVNILFNYTRQEVCFFREKVLIIFYVCFKNVQLFLKLNFTLVISHQNAIQ